MTTGTSATDLEIDALRASIAGDLPAYLIDLEQLVNIDCGTYTPQGVDEVGRWTAGFLSDLGAEIDIRPDPNGRFAVYDVRDFVSRQPVPKSYPQMRS